jgi:hypothetical protein
MSLLPAITMIATFLFGIFPATLLMIGAVILGVGGLMSLGEVALNPAMVKGGFGALSLVLALAIPVPIMAAYGLAGLFYAAGGQVTTRVARWLVVGIAANAAGIGFIAFALRWSWDEAVVLLSPIVVASAHLAWFARSRHCGANV